MGSVHFSEGGTCAAPILTEVECDCEMGLVYARFDILIPTSRFDCLILGPSDTEPNRLLRLFLIEPPHHVQGPLPRDEVVRDYLRFCVRYDNTTQNTKYVVQQMLQVNFSLSHTFAGNHHL